MTGMPEPGSPLEVATILIVQKRSLIRFYEVRAIAQASIQSELKDKQRAIEDLFFLHFPSSRRRREKEEEAVHRLLDRWTGLGPIRITKGGTHAEDRKLRPRHDRR